MVLGNKVNKVDPPRAPTAAAAQKPGGGGGVKPGTAVGVGPANMRGAGTTTTSNNNLFGPAKGRPAMPTSMQGHHGQGPAVVAKPGLGLSGTASNILAGSRTASVLGGGGQGMVNHAHGPGKALSNVLAGGNKGGLGGTLSNVFGGGVGHMRTRFGGTSASSTITSSTSSVVASKKVPADFSSAALPVSQPAAPVPCKEIELLRLESVRDIDCNDESPQLAPEYIADITNYLFKLERATFTITEKFLEGSQLNGRMRSVLLDWIVQVHLQFGFKQETLYIATNLLDRYLLLERNVSRQQLQLVGVTATYIAVKYEEISIPTIHDLASVSDGAFNPKELLKMEEKILKKLNFDLSPPIPPFFLRRCSKAANADITIHQLAKFVMELGVMDYSTCHFRPSLVAAASLALAMMIINKKPLALLWTPTIEHYSRYKIPDMKNAIRSIVNVLAAAYEDNGKLNGVRKKFASSKQYHISTNENVNPASWRTWLPAEINRL